MTMTQLQPTQNTAPIVEFSCLYTHDVRRKAKRWQDGLLRYHTFNRRVMVYDLARNFIGDTFNQTGLELQAGDELELEKHFALVEVSHQTAVVQQDLTELNKSRQRKEPKQVANHTPIAPITISSPAYQTRRTPAPSLHKHRSLEDMLGGTRAPIGKAFIPIKSPFEQKQALNVSRDERPQKKSRVESNRGAVVQSASTKKSTTLATTTHPSRVIDLSSSYPIDTPTKSAKVPTNSRVTNSDITTPIPRQETPLLQQDQEMTSQHIEDASQNRRPLRVISNAPRKMLLYRQPPSRKPDISKTLGQYVPEPPVKPHRAAVDPQHLRLQERLAKIGKRRRQSAGLDQGTSECQPPATEIPQTDAMSAPAKTPPDIEQGLLGLDAGKDTATSTGNFTTLHQEVPTNQHQATDDSPRSLESRVNPKRHERVGTKTAVSTLRRTTSAPVAAQAPQPIPTKSTDPLDFGPWSREAQDLFDWWPPDRDKAGHKIIDANKDMSTK